MQWKLSNIKLTMNQLLYTAGNIYLHGLSFHVEAKKKDLVTQYMQCNYQILQILIVDEPQRVWMAYEWKLANYCI